MGSCVWLLGSLGMCACLQPRARGVRGVYVCTASSMLAAARAWHLWCLCVYGVQSFWLSFTTYCGVVCGFHRVLCGVRGVRACSMSMAPWPSFTACVWCVVHYSWCVCKLGVFGSYASCVHLEPFTQLANGETVQCPRGGRMLNTNLGHANCPPSRKHRWQTSICVWCWCQHQMGGSVGSF